MAAEHKSMMNYVPKNTIKLVLLRDGDERKENTIAEPVLYKWQPHACRPMVLKLRNKAGHSHMWPQHPLVRNSPYNVFFANSKERKLRFAVSTNNYESVCRHLEEGADPNCSDDHLRRPLHLASCNGYKEVIRALIRHGADPNLKDSMGNTPLHLAVCTNHMPVVVDLLNAGSNIASLNKHGRNPLQLAQSKLKLIQLKPHGFDAEKLKSDIRMIVEMMVKYMHVQKVNSKDVEALALRLEKVTTQEEVTTEVSLLLENFENMNLSK